MVSKVNRDIERDSTTHFESFKQKYESYQQELKSIEDVLQGLCKFLSDVTYECVDGEDLSYYNKFQISYGEVVTNFNFGDNIVEVDLQYFDYYDGYDTESTLRIPSGIFNMWMLGDKEGVTKRVIQLCYERKAQQEQEDLRKLEMLASDLGYKIVKENEHE